jgi:hypothetical protein
MVQSFLQNLKIEDRMWNCVTEDLLVSALTEFRGIESTNEGAAHLENVYDTQNDLLEIKEFEYRGYGRRDIEVLLSMPDQQLLSLLSTSPEVEVMELSAFTN